MITGFEEYTKELSVYEENVLLPVIIEGLTPKIGVENAIKNATAIAKLRSKGYIISPARFRKILHIIRVSGMVKRVVATSKGYFITNDKAELLKYINSLTDRIAHITNLKNAIEEQTYE